VDKVRLIKKDKKKVEERLDLLNQRQELKQAFIRKKQAVRSEIGLLKTKAEGLGILKERDLKELQEEFREIDQEFRDMGVMADRDELFDGVRPREDDPSKMNNKQLLGKALDTQKDTHAKLKVWAALCGTSKQCGCCRSQPQEQSSCPRSLAIAGGFGYTKQHC